jgi:IS4 transposase
MLLHILKVFILFIFQQDLTANEELFNFFIVILGITALIMILVYILLTSKQEE